MSEKKERLKQTMQKMLRRLGRVAAIGAFSVDPLAGQEAEPLPKGENVPATELQVPLSSLLSEPAPVSAVAKGRRYEFSALTPYDLGHIYESEMKPAVMDPERRYIGLFQMDVGATMNAFISYLQKHEQYRSFAARLKAFKGNRRSADFQKLWLSLDGEAFRRGQNEFMQEAKYDKVIKRLNLLPGFEAENRGKAFMAGIMARANQFSAVKVELIYGRAYRQAWEEARQRCLAAGGEFDSSAVKTADIIKNAYRISAEIYPAGRKRFREEGEFALAWNRYEEKLSSLRQAEKIIMTDASKLGRGNRRSLELTTPKVSVGEKLPILPRAVERSRGR